MLYPRTRLSRVVNSTNWALGTRLLAWSALLATLGAPAAAQELEPRRYSNIPVGLNFVGFGYAY
jgi:hypothetical protein